MILQRFSLPLAVWRWFVGSTLAVAAGCATEPEPPIKCETSGCNDGNPCTKDECEPLSGCKHSPQSGGACTDGDVCTTADVCKAGACAAGAPLACTDDNVCTKDTCDPSKGCTFTAAGGPCDDGNPCTEADACKAGSCGAGATKQCNDGDPCTTDGCDAGQCTAKPATGAPCDDGDACTKADTCADKGCTGVAIVCGDTNPCTTESCDKKSGCKTTVNSEPCDDGSKCTKADICNDGGCKGAPVDCDDGVGCTIDNCDATSGCQLAAVATLCSDDNACTVDNCDAKAGCTHADLDKLCDDGSQCTTGDQCSKGYCFGKPVSCDDDNACSLDVCLPGEGCKHSDAENGKLCNDADACTVADVCKAGKCKGAINSCDDGNACTTDDCDPKAGCSQKPVAASPCDDSNACTIGDHCDAMKCNPGKTAKDCDDKNPCTIDECDAMVGCKNTAIGDGNACSDDDACTNDDACKGGKCEATQLICNDNNLCTDDSCDKGKGCMFVPVGNKACDDKDACTIGDTCAGGSCAPGKTVKDCDDSKSCTVDSCAPSIGCINTAVEFKECEDGNACSADDTCTAQGECVSVTDTVCNDNKACTVDTCDKNVGCVFSPTLADCNDGNVCTVDEKCTAGNCEGGKPLNCDDGNGCTSDSCKSESGGAGGCVYKANEAVACDDGNACTKNDACSKSANCGGWLQVNCDDDNACTIDVCSADYGCLYKNWDGHSCNDGDSCTSGEVCQNAKCSGGSKADCEDYNECTDDGCSPKYGCFHKALGPGSPCDDGVPCTPKSYCSEGKCKVGDYLKCNDGNPCTIDGCDLANGNCKYTYYEGMACDDGNSCTTADKCTTSGCKGVGLDCSDGNACTADSCVNNKCSNAPIGCDDKNACTTDSCLLSSGCQFKANSLGCDDDNACTQQDTCVMNLCAGLLAVNCDDDNPCTADGCNPKTGCTHQDLTGTDCTDKNACTTKEVCKAGTCTTSPTSCDDGNDCTTDSCNIVTGCAHADKVAWTACYDDSLKSACDGQGVCEFLPFSKGVLPVPASTAAVGCNKSMDSSCPADASPAHLAKISAFWLDYIEVTNLKFRQCWQQGGCKSKPASGSGCTFTESSNSAYDLRPVNCVTSIQAAEYCKWAGKRLPTEHEWELAARGACAPDKESTCLASTPPYPWGNAGPSCSLANFNESGYFGCGAGLPWKVGTGKAGPYGHLDLIGNVWEFTSDQYDSLWYGKLAGAANGEPQLNPDNSYVWWVPRMIRGGGYDSPAQDLRGYVRKSWPAESSHPAVGFRCAQSPK